MSRVPQAQTRAKWSCPFRASRVREVLLVEDWPMSATKIDKGVLRERAAVAFTRRG